MPFRKLSAFEKCAWTTLSLMALSLPLLFWGAIVSFRSTHNSPVAWLPADSLPRQHLMEFTDSFQTEDMLVVSWEGCTLEDPRLSKFAEIVQSRQSELLETNLAGTVLDGNNATERLIYDAELTRIEAIERLQGLLVGRDGETTCALLPTHFRSQEGRAKTVDFLQSAAEDAGVSAHEIHLAGAYVEGVAIDAASTQSFKLYMLPSMILVGVICWFCLRSWRLAAAVLSVAGYSAVLIIGVLPVLGINLNAVLVVMAPLLVVLTVSAGVHMVNYYLDEWRSGSNNPARAALAAGWWPCTFCTLTTSIGMGSLTLSEIVPVRQFGGLTAAGVLITLGLLFLVLPGAMNWHARCSTAPAPRLSQARPWGRTTRLTERGWLPIMAVGLIVMIAGFYGVSRVQTSISVMNLLPEDHKLVQDYHWLEDHIGPLVPIEVLVHFDGACELDDVQRVEVIRRIENKLYGIDLLGSVFSGSTFLPYVPEEGGFRGTMERTVLRRRMPGIKEQLRTTSWLASTEERETWRISARVPAFGDENYDKLMNGVQQQVNHQIAHEMVPGLDATYTGLAPVVSHAQQMLLNDLFRSLVAALGLVTLVLMIVFRSLGAGLLAMIPNVFPSVLLFGGLGLLGIPVDIGTVMTASVALGIAVDDTIHFLTWFRREHQSTGSRTEAIRKSFGHSASAMLQTTAVCGLGLASFALADFVPTAQFAWMMIALLGLAIVGDLLLLPALLTGPLGAYFEPRSPCIERSVSSRPVSTNINEQPSYYAE